jgi:hypothetical protein
MDQLPFYQNETSFIRALKQLHSNRKANKIKSNRQILTFQERSKVLEKTDFRCHVCGIELTERFQADHVKCHSSGGDHNVANYLPACDLCNNYRWHYSPQEIQWILKLGVWAKTQIKEETKTGMLLSALFIQHEIRREKRRKTPRTK